MFYEIDPQLIKNSEESGKKRWFRDGLGEYDLFVWEDEDSAITKIQFWYHEALLEWSKADGYKTGSMDPKSGAFISYQSDLYRFHKELDQEILSMVKHVMDKSMSEEEGTFNYIRDILSDIADHM